jgi:capsule polysaccharide export protein KpsE/RkpR
MTNDIHNPRALLVDNFEGSRAYLEADERRAARERTTLKLRLLIRRRRTIFRWTVAGLIVSIIAAFLIPRRFTSTTRLMPPDQSGIGMSMLAALTGGISGKSGGSSIGLAGLAGDLLGLKTSGALFVGIVESRTVEDDLISKFNLRKVYWDRKWEDARKDLTSHTDVSEDRKSGIITISVSDKKPARATAMAQEYVEQLDRMVMVLNTTSAHRERVFLEQRLKQVNSDLENAEKNFSQFASKNSTLDVKEQGKAMIEAGAELEGQLIAAQTELQGLKQIYTDNNVRVRTIQARIDELKKQIAKVGGTSSPQMQPSGSDADALYPPLRQLPLVGVPWADLYRETKVQEAIFETLTQEYELAKVQEAKDTPSVKVIDPPSMPEKGFPPRSWTIGIGTLLAFAFSISFVLGSARWDEIDPADPGKVLVIEVLEAAKSFALPNGTNGSNGHSGKRNPWSASRNADPSPKDNNSSHQEE